jgi:hypothetical protein
MCEVQKVLANAEPFSNRSDKRKRKMATTTSLASLQVISLVRPRRRLSLAPTVGSRRRRAQVVSRLAASSAATEGLALIRPSTTARWLDRGLPLFLLFLASHSVVLLPHQGHGSLRSRLRAAATSGSKHRRCKVHSELARWCGSTATAAVICTFAPEGNQWIDV